MKNTLNYIALAAVSLSVAACSQENHESSYLSDSKAVHISAQIGTGGVTGGFQTRSNPLDDERTTIFENEDKIAVTAGSQSAVVYRMQLNGEWIPDPTTDYLVWESDNMDFTAYYPANNMNGASFTAFSQPTDYTGGVTDLSNGDYMTFSGQLNNSEGNAVTLNMKRRMARLVISTTFKNQYASGYEVHSVEIHSNASGYANGAVQRSDDGIDITAYKHTGNGKFYALLVPTFEDADKTFLTITVRNTDTDVTENLTVKGIPAVKEGYSYNMDVIVGKDKADVGNVTVSDWNDGKVIEEGSTNEVQPATANAETNTITTHDEGQLTQKLIEDALAGGKTLKIVGPMGTTDFTTLQDCNVEDLSLDLSGAIFKEIPYRGFETKRNNTSFIEIILPQTLEKIGSTAFECALIKEITIPKNVHYLSSGVFLSCWSLTKIVFEGDLNGKEPALGFYCFNNCESLTTIDMSACTNVPTINKKSPPMEDYYKSKNIKILVKNDIIKDLFEKDDWFKDFTIEIKPEV